MKSLLLSSRRASGDGGGCRGWKSGGGAGCQGRGGAGCQAQLGEAPESGVTMATAEERATMVL
jgi:hypothetical protein